LYRTAIYKRRGRKVVLTEDEEKELVDYVTNMQEIGYPLMIRHLREKVKILTQTQVTPFMNGVPSAGWVKYFRRRHEELTIRNSQSLE